MNFLAQLNDPVILAAAILAIAALLLTLLIRRAYVKDQRLPLPPAMHNLYQYLGRAVESGRQLHVTLGRGRIEGAEAVSSVSALHILDHVAQDGIRNGSAPFVSVGDGSLLPLAQASMRSASRQRESLPLTGDQVQFIADDAHPLAYGVGVSSGLTPHTIGAHLLVGRLGSEVALLAEPAARQEQPQLIGSDDLQGLAVAAAYSDELLIGETFLSSEAYLKQSPTAVAAAIVQNTLRWGVILTLAGTAVLALFG